MKQSTSSFPNLLDTAGGKINCAFPRTPMLLQNVKDSRQKDPSLGIATRSIGPNKRTYKKRTCLDLANPFLAFQPLPFCLTFFLSPCIFSSFFSTV